MHLEHAGAKYIMTNNDPSTPTRRQFLRIGLNNNAIPIRPPWAIEEHAFQGACTRCGDCIASCPDNILMREGTNGYPVVGFTHGECTFCGDCARVCPSTALNRFQSPVWNIKAHVSETCLTKQQVLCMSCADHCDVRAIRFTPVAGVVSQPEINIDDCTGCGACVASCPAHSIEVKHV